MRNFIYVTTCILLLGVPFTGISQQADLKLSLEEALQKAMENNWQINKVKQQAKSAKAEFRETNSIFLPNVNVSHTGIATNDPLAAFGFKLKQEITTQADFDPARLNNPDRIENFATKLEVKQPLLNLDGLYGRKAAKAKMQAVDFTTERSIQYTKFEVKKAYYQLELAQEAVWALEKSKKAAQSALKRTEDNLQQGFVKEADLLEAKIRVLDLENQLAEAKNQQKQAGEYLAYLLGLDISTSISTLDRLDQKPALLKSIGQETEEGFRSDLMAYRKGIEAGKSMLASQKMKFLPRLNAFGGYEWNDGRIFGTSAKNYRIGASLSWNLFGGYKNIAKVQKAKAELKIAELNLGEYQSKNRMEIRGAKRNLKVAYDQIEVSRIAKEQAEEAFRIRNNRYQQGLETTSDLLYSESLSLNRNLAYIHALYKYHIAVFQLELLLEKDLL